MKITRTSTYKDGSVVQVTFEDRQEYGAFLTKLHTISGKCYAGLQKRGADLPLKWLITRMEEDAVPDGRKVAVTIEEKDAMHLFAVLSGLCLLVGDILDCM